MTNLAKLSHSTEMISRWELVCCARWWYLVSITKAKIYIGPEVGFIVQRVFRNQKLLFPHYLHLTLLRPERSFLFSQVQCPSRDDPA